MAREDSTEKKKLNSSSAVNNRGKAFLSYSSDDRALVSKIASELGRESAIYDERTFDSGYSLDDAIKDGLDRSSVFVLFASRSSVGKDRGKWLRLEDREGKQRSVDGLILRPMCFIIDDSVGVDDLPKWLIAARVGVFTENVPKLIAHKIKQHLNDLVVATQTPPVVGRGIDSDRAKRVINPIEGVAARTVAFFGINGIGRRTLCKQVFRDLFTLHDLHEVRIEEGDNLPDISLKLAASLGLVSSNAEIASLKSETQRENSEQLVARCVAYLQSIVNANYAPVFFDDGGILDSDGHLTRPVDEIRKKVTRENDTLLALILSRRLSDEASLKAQAVPTIRVDALSVEDTGLLISSLANKESLALDTHTVRALALWVRGHPPAAAHTVELLLRDGISQVIDGSQIVAYRDSYFIRALERDGALTKARQLILRALAEYMHLPEESLIAVSGKEKSKYDEEIRYLLDKAFVTPEKSGLYRIADPLIDSIRKIFSGTGVPHEAVADGLESFLKKVGQLTAEDPDNPNLRVGRIEAERLLWRANTSIGKPDRQNFHFAADIISSLRSAFHERRYEDAERQGYTAIEVRPDSAVARSLLIRALVRQTKYGDASEQIEIMIDRGYLRDAYYLKGYLDQHQGDHQNAAYNFRQAIHYGRADAMVSRDLAESLFYSGEYSDAEHYVKEALKKEPDNRFSLDLLVRVLVRRGEFAKARVALKQLQVWDDSAFFLHRKSVLELAEGNLPEALKDAEAAYDLRKKDASIQVQFVICQVAAGHLGDAKAGVEQLSRLNAQDLDPDVTVSLQIRLANARRKYEDSLVLCGKFKDKDKLQHLALRAEALRGFIKSLSATDPRVSGLSKEREAILTKIGAQPLELISAASTFFK